MSWEVLAEAPWGARAVLGAYHQQSRLTPRAGLALHLVGQIGKGWIRYSLCRLSLFNASLHACGGGFASGLCVDGGLLRGLLFSGNVLVG